ncbi:flagellar brake protein [Niallia taxi]|uniref:flagellar brake protein n=1 Tax=Niallia taxi TaxID=2499688 RepID=UPI003008ECCA
MINIGDTLILEPAHSEAPEQYKCRLVEMNDNEIFIDYPINSKTKKAVFLLNGTQLKVSFVTSHGTVYMFDSEIIGREKQGNIPMLLLHYPPKDQWIKIQRREYVRVETSVDVAITSIHNELKPFATITTDISAGGAAILVPKDSNMKAETIVEPYFVLPMQNGEYYYPKVQAHVKSIFHHNETHNKAPLEFLEVSPADRQLFLRFCFDRQLSFRKKGLEL